MVEIFKTNVESLSRANIIVSKLLKQFPTYRINFDLNDCDKILRIETCGGTVEIEAIIKITKQYSEISLIAG